MPKISVIIPHYNRPKLLTEALESVLSQDFSDFECIVVDDGSSEPLPELPADPRLRLIEKFHSGLPGEVRNRGVEASSGEYLAFLDSDDLWLPDKLLKQLSALESGEVRLVHTREVWLRCGKTVSQASQRHKRDGEIFSDALKKCIIGPSTVMMERSLFDELGGFDETLEIGEDYEFWLRLTAFHRVGYIDGPLTVKRAGPWYQLSEKYGQIEIFRIAALRKLVDARYFPSDKMTEARSELVRKCRIYASGCKKRGKDGEALEYMMLADVYE